MKMKETMKKTLVMFLAIMMVMSMLAGCGSPKEEKTPDSTAGGRLRPKKPKNRQANSHTQARQ